MTSKLPFNFLVDKVNNQIRVAKTFDASLPTVWDMWTKAEYLDKWWAPKPYRAETKSMEFKPGGSWFYAMVSPANERHWCVANYEAIENRVGYAYTDAFTNENGAVDPTFPSTYWTVDFAAISGTGTTQVNIVLQYASLEDLEKIIELGFREGFSMCLGNLDELFESTNKLASQTLYHGTKASLNNGDLIAAGFNSNYGQRNKAKYVYLTGTLDAAIWGAELASGEGQGRIYIVAPTGLLEDDPNLTDKKFPGNPTKSYRTKSPLRVMGEVADWQGHSPEQLKTMKDHLEKLKEQGIEAIED